MDQREGKIIQAVQAVRDGMSKLKASKMFGVPRSTIQFRMGQKFKKPGFGPSTYLTYKEEEVLVEWILTCQRKGFPRRIEDVQHSVQNIVKETARNTPFRDGLPGKGWYRAFVKRHPELCLRTTEAVTQASSCISEADIRNWFKTIETELHEEEFKNILLDGNRIFNGDETNFLLCPKNKKVIAIRGTKNVYEVDQGAAKAALTVMFTFCANGDLTPPMIIYPYKRKPPKEVLETVPKNWGVGYSDNGWMKSSLFYEYIANVFNPYLVNTKTKKPVILFVDGHKTHLTLQVNQLCTSLGIILIALYPNATRLLQPADVAAFKPLKSGWQKGILQWRREHPMLQFTKENFAPLLSKVIDDYVKDSTIINGFKATGLFPWNCNALDYSKCMGHMNANRLTTTQNDHPANTINEPVLNFQTFKTFLGEDLVNLFETGNQSNNSPEVNSLFKIWRFFENTNLTDDNILYDEENVSIKFIEDVDMSCQTDKHPLNEDTGDVFDPVLKEALDKFDANFTTHETTYEEINSLKDNITKQDSLLCTPIHEILHWPDSPKRKNKKQVEKMPFVITSEKWRQMAEDKEEKKKSLEEEKQRKKKVREEKKKIANSRTPKLKSVVSGQKNKKSILKATKNKKSIRIQQNVLIKASAALGGKTEEEKLSLERNSMSKTPPNEEKLLENVSLYLSSLEDKIKIHHLQEKTNHRDWSELNPVLKSIENKTSKHTQQNVLVKASVALKAESGVEKSSSVRNSMITTEPNNENCLDNFSPQWSSKGEEIKTHNSQKKTYQKSECKFLASGICYKCTENITPKRMGRKCSKCIRTFHFKCQYNFFAKPFICIKCIIF